jgi:hypothetical protein
MITYIGWHLMQHQVIDTHETILQTSKKNDEDLLLRRHGGLQEKPDPLPNNKTDTQ